jgi:hypothetical protein
LFNLKKEYIMKAVITKSVLREQTSEALQEFLARGGVVQVVKARKAPKQTMSGKTTRNSSGSTNGFAMGFVRSGI